MSLLQFFNSLEARKSKFNIWAFSDTHVSNGPTQEAHLANAIADANSLMNFDIVVNGGDTFSRGFIGDSFGTTIVNVLDNLTANGHSISDIYSIMGNHDDTGLSDPEAEANYYWKRYIDSSGSFPGTSKIVNANRPYQIRPLGSTNYASYYIEVGNMLMIFLGDRNDGDPPAGENGIVGGGTPYDGLVGGALTSTEWNAFTSLVEANKNKIILVTSHQPPYESTTRSGFQEFWDSLYPGLDYDAAFTYPEANRYAGCIGYIEQTLSISTIDTWLQANSQYIDLWMHGHCHRSIGEIYNGRTRKENKFDMTVLNICSVQGSPGEVLSNLISIEGRALTSKTYVHDTWQGSAPVGWYDPEEFTMQLKRTLIT